MRWLKRLVAKWAREEEWTNSAKVAFAEDSPRRSIDHNESSETIRFNLTPAVGGRILRVNRESNQRGLSLGPSETSQLYVIPSGEDVGQRVAKIINIELLK